MTSESTATKALEPLKKSRVALLTTYKRSGVGVATPVGRILKDDRVFFNTRSKTWKVKRLANNPRVTLAPCTRRGKPLGPTVEGVARLVPPKAQGEMSTFERIQSSAWILVYRLMYRDRPLTYEVRPAGPDEDPFAQDDGGR
ncbi:MULTISPECIES: PPOX class F420-dependent oxidoreductase [Streptomyces]|uniref:PPOX class F420-dependent oxidoreductase n=1 Tax=Streptomyces huasconensis TaxID=1854574 RepID=A0ABV3M7C3_9ACTN|nr:MULTISPECIES: PPOX class F420-dependent oxidoreductase [Streptomyces]UFQ18597.1 PPOX class F420-dependent oxidoreductase [Streptomyces huasconensis]WCL88212.1 PPOX class F420-dependent oxidoreductase [Streptomyces sp. JCM 35825]